MRHLILVLFTAILAAGEAAAPDLITQESIAKAQATAADKPTPEMIIAKVKAGVALLAKEGDAALAKFKGKDSEFIFAGTYIWIHDQDGRMVMHPMLPKMEGKELLGLKDKNGKLFFVEMNRLALDGSGGWSDYWWPKPGEKEPSLKVSYVEAVQVGGRRLVLGCGVYDLPQAEMDKILKR